MSGQEGIGQELPVSLFKTGFLLGWDGRKLGFLHAILCFPGPAGPGGRGNGRKDLGAAREFRRLKGEKTAGRMGKIFFIRRRRGP